MAVNYLIFGNADSRDFDIEVFYNDIDRTPKRVYERVEVPNRNGAILIDAKRYEDVPVSYDCIALDDEDRKEFLNALASQIGYKRMEDSFNSDEYYSAVFEGDVDPNMTAERDKSTFTVYFTRKPQRWLKSGETAVSVESSDEITNPTLFASSPMLEVEGHGTIAIGNYSIQLNDIPLGDVVISRADLVGVDSISFDTSQLNTGDRIHLLGNDRFEFLYNIRVRFAIQSITIQSVSDCKCTTTQIGTYNCGVYVRPDATEFVYGTASTISMTAVVKTIIAGTQEGTTNNAIATLAITMSYDGDSTITFVVTPSFNFSAFFGTCKIEGVTPTTIYGESSQSALGDPTYIDCELGECYAIRDGQIVSLNKGVDLGSDLPTLAPGANTVTFDNTITDLQVVPRWWKI